jgi:hypothetical protein
MSLDDKIKSVQDEEKRVRQRNHEHSYYQRNKEKIAIRKKEYYQRNKERILERKREKRMEQQSFTEYQELKKKANLVDSLLKEVEDLKIENKKLKEYLLEQGEIPL